MKSPVFEEPLPFSDYVIFYFVDKFGIAWFEFYHVLLVLITGVAIGGWVVAFYTYTKCQRDIIEAIEEEEHKR